MIEENSGPVKSVPLSEVSHLVSVPLSEVLLYMESASQTVGFYSMTYPSLLGIQRQHRFKCTRLNHRYPREFSKLYGYNHCIWTHSFTVSTPLRRNQRNHTSMSHLLRISLIQSTRYFCWVYRGNSEWEVCLALLRMTSGWNPKRFHFESKISLCPHIRHVYLFIYFLNLNLFIYF